MIGFAVGCVVGCFIGMVLTAILSVDAYDKGYEDACKCNQPNKWGH
jgi:hypothetical protein